MLPPPSPPPERSRPPPASSSPLVLRRMQRQLQRQRHGKKRGHTTPGPDDVNSISTTTLQQNTHQLDGEDYKHHQHHDDIDNEDEERRFVMRETRSVNILRVTVLVLLLLTATGVCVGTYYLALNNEEMLHRQEHESNALRIVDSFHRTVQMKLASIDSLSIDITSYAIQQRNRHRDEDEAANAAAAANASANETSSSSSSSKYSFFPFITVPDFEVKGSAARVEADAVIIHWTPLVSDDQRDDWERYAYEHRFQIDDAYTYDAKYRRNQDESFGFSNPTRSLQDEQGNDNQDQPAEGNVLDPRNDNTTGYNYRVWSIGAITPRGPELEGTGPFLPLWQRSPINDGKQKILNSNFATSRAVYGALPVILQDHTAVMNMAAIPLPDSPFLGEFQANLAISQYRHEYDDIGLTNDPLTFISYPVFDSFDIDSRKVAGVIHTNIYWKLLFTNVLNEHSMPSICVLKNSFNQSLTYRINGPRVDFVGEGDHHDPKFDHLGYTTNVNNHIEALSSSSTRSYTSVPLSQKFGTYEIHVYPAEDLEYSKLPSIHTAVIAITLIFVSVVYVYFTVQVERRQKKMMDRAVQNARNAAAAERELNEFLSHEVRNPLSAAIAACTFVDAALQEQENKYYKHGRIQPVKKEDTTDSCQHKTETTDDNDTVVTDVSTLTTPENPHRFATDESMEVHKTMRDDVRIIYNALHFVNDFLRSMLDIHRAAAKKLKLNLTPADIRKDILDPVSNLLYQRDTNVDIFVECPENIIVETDPLRLKQVILNLGTNSAKFVEKGFIRLIGRIVDDHVELVVEDTGTGIPIGKRLELFSKYQASLDAIGQGTGFGLSLCKSLVSILGGDISLDDTYDSGIKGCPGARFVVRLNSTPLPMSHFEQSDSPQMLDSEDNTLAASTSQQSGRDNVCATDNLKGQIDGECDELPRNLKVLFVDDDLMLRKLFIRAVKKVAPDWIINEAASGESAINMFEEHCAIQHTNEITNEPFDLVFMDMYMASTDKQLLGTETVRMLRSKGIKSIIVGLSANNLEHKFIASGANAFVLKPIPCKPNDLKSELLRVIACCDTRKLR